jgi:phospholipid/cholesterol/gamma-HCH transport system substrate-binding protein
LVGDQRKKLDGITSNINSITNNIKENNDKLTNVIKNFSNISDSLAKANIANTLHNANIALKSVSEVVEKINNGEGSLGLLLNDKKLYSNLESSTKDLDKLLIDMKEHPSRYVHFSIFGKKDKAEEPSTKK